MAEHDYFGAKDTFDTGSGEAVLYRLSTAIARASFSSRRAAPSA